MDLDAHQKGISKMGALLGKTKRIQKMETLTKEHKAVERPPFKPAYDHFIGGKWVAPSSGEYFDNISPIDGKVFTSCLLYTSPSPRDRQKSRMPSSA